MKYSFVPLKADNGSWCKNRQRNNRKIICYYYDTNRDVILKTYYQKVKAHKRYVITSLETGDYTVEVAQKADCKKTNACL